MKETTRVPVVIYRGGTSRGVFFRAMDVPTDPQQRDKFLLEVMGSPDRSQLNGLGGGTAVTSKVGMVGPSIRPDADVDFTFAQVAIDQPLVEYLGNCGNLSAAVGPYAIEEGFVHAQIPTTKVRIYNTNTGKHLLSEVPVGESGVYEQGDFSMPGIEGTGARIQMTYFDPGGSVTGKLLPTGNVIDILHVDGLEPLKVSFVDAANPFVFVAASDIGLVGTELPDEFNLHAEILDLSERIRQAAASYLGIGDQSKDPTEATLDVPKIALIAPGQAHTCLNGIHLQAAEIDLVARMVVGRKPVYAYAMTGAFCTAAAAVIPGTLVNSMVGRETEHFSKIKIAHPTGVMDVDIRFRHEDGGIYIESVGIGRTARRIMDGHVLVDPSLFQVQDRLHKMVEEV